MRKCFYIALFITAHAFAGNTNPVKKDTTEKTRIFSVGGGIIRTSLNFFKNYQEQTTNSGYNVRALFQPAETFRFCLGYSRVESVNIYPTWVNVNNSFVDLDAHFIMHFVEKQNIAYFIIGASGQYWNGFYTGIHDLNAYKIHATPNSNYHALYYGAKMGMGAEIKLYGPISGYGEFIFRFSKTDVGTGLSDVLYGLGLKVNLSHSHKKNGKRHHSFLSFKDKYKWF